MLKSFKLNHIAAGFVGMMVGWSIPGVALLITSFSLTSMQDAIGAFIFAAGLTAVCGYTGLFERVMRHELTIMLRTYNVCYLFTRSATLSENGHTKRIGGLFLI
tara:strand:- start:634 stop:945 length:312 start_codon:yes stop_codon:yes gene_type:complete